MNNETRQLILELKENNEDFEFYPTTKEMVKVIYDNIDRAVSSVLDIGCGTCNFKKYFKEFSEEDWKKYDEKKAIYENSYISGKGYNQDLRPSDNEKGKSFGLYYVIEKSQTLINKLDKDTIVLGTDFYNTLLIDKKADVYFCNPPYSDYETWTSLILENGNCNEVFMIIPERWKENEQIKRVIEKYNIDFKILGSFDFTKAERQARAKVEVIQFIKNKKIYEYGYRFRDRLEEFNKDAFNNWFDETFKMRDSSKENKYEWEIEKEEKQKIKNELVSCKSKGDYLVNLYNQEQAELFNHFKAICSLDTNTLETIGVKKEAIKEAIKQKIKSLKVKYWQIVFEEFEEITDRLTSETREKMLNNFSSLMTVDFTLENIYPLILWVVKHANEYYNEQLLSFFYKLTSPDNIKNYKSNQKVFERDNWRHIYFKNIEEVSHYTLDYRIIMSSPFTASWYDGTLDSYQNKAITQLKDLFTIARNLGFNTPSEVRTYHLISKWGEKIIIEYADSHKTFMEYRAYKNGNMHVKFDMEFAKALNVECSRLLGWIRSKEDIEREFPSEMAQGAEKYFKQNYTCIGNINNLLLTVNN